MDWIKIAAAIFGGYVIGNFIIFRQLDATDYWEVIGYIHGLVRGAGSKEKALQNLVEWRNYWMAERPYLSWLIEHFYQHGLYAVDVIYG